MQIYSKFFMEVEPIIKEMTKKWETNANKVQKENSQTRRWGNALKKLASNPQYPSLNTHEILPLSKRYGMRVWQSYLENKKSGARRMYWVYGPDHSDITIIGLEPHPEDSKNGAYDRINLSELS